MKKNNWKIYYHAIGRFMLLVMMSIPYAIHAQVGIDVPDPDPSSVLDLNVASRDRGLLIPRVSSAERENIAEREDITEPADGLLVFDETQEMFYFWNGTSSKWQALNPFTYRKGSNAVDEDNLVISLTNNKSVVIGSVASPTRKLEVGGDVRASGNISSSTMSTTGDITVAPTGKFVGYGTIPVGGIIMWSGNSSTIPDGWALCDGTTYDGYPTPNLKGRFIVGYDPDREDYDQPGNYSTTETSKQEGDTGGEETVKLTIDEMPSHVHNILHTHNITDPGHSHTIRMSDSAGEGTTDDAGNGNRANGSTESATTGITVSNFTGDSSATGGDQPHENRPPYYVLAFIIRIK